MKANLKDAYNTPIWLMYECELGKRWTAVKGGGCEHDLKDPCGFSGCDSVPHQVTIKGETPDRNTAYDWFRR